LTFLYILWYIYTTIRQKPTRHLIMETFAERIRNERISAGLTLREFCRRINYDPSNWSKVERGVNPPPQSSVVLSRILAALGKSEDKDFAAELKELAAIDSIPDDLIDKKIKDQLPIFFRTVRGEQPSEEELKKLVTSIKKAWTRTK
jgi:transcriptional regulator with XRE-family HTH domain